MGEYPNARARIVCLFRGFCAVQHFGLDSLLAWFGSLPRRGRGLNLPKAVAYARFNGKFSNKFCGFNFNLPSASIAIAR